MDRESQVTERYSRSVEQLGHESQEVRIGGIYALARIAKDSAPDRQTVLEVLTAYIREHAKRPPQDEQGQLEGVTERSPRGDIAAAIDVIRRWEWPFARALDLRTTELPNVELGNAELSSANLSKANLSGADLFEAHLNGAYLVSVDLSGANLFGAKLRKARLSQAKLSEATLCSADLSFSDLSEADLSGAKLWSADLSFSDLSEADLSGADLRAATVSPQPGTITLSEFEEDARLVRANLSKACYSANTRWPEGFDPEAAGAVLGTEG